MHLEKKKIEFNSFGPILNMDLPDLWLQQESRKTSLNDIKSFCKFHDPQDENIQICLYYRGLPISKNSSMIFSKILNSGEFMLSQEQVESLQEVLGDLAFQDDFQLDKAIKTDLNGRNVLAVDGIWPKLNLRSKNIYIDGRGDGSIIYELYYAAPQDRFDEFLPQVEDSFASVQWQKF